MTVRKSTCHEYKVKRILMRDVDEKRKDGPHFFPRVETGEAVSFTAYRTVEYS